MNLRTLVLNALALTCACASVPMAPPDADLAAKKFEPPAGHANLYVYRNETFGSAIRLSVLLDEMQLGSTAAKTYLYAPISPGKHRLVSKAENDSSLELDVEPGKNYFLWQEVKMGVWSARSLLQQVDDQRGKEGVLECQMGVTNTPIARPAVYECGKDTDCKGTRVCDRGACVDARN
ncbi:MAG: DUF2846 domain-containing protein [Myxococcales bacterium]|nr:DUF2846 domain-containing protein [Myxococcales bacterium]